MENSEDGFVQDWQDARDKAGRELGEIRKTDETALSSNQLVRKAILMQLEEAPEGTAEEVESTLLRALELDGNNLEAYVELGRFYYSVQDDSLRAREVLLRGLQKSGALVEELINSILLCDEELSPDSEMSNLRLQYRNIVVSADS